MYERKHHALLPRIHFHNRVLKHVLVALLILSVTLLIGMVGHMIIEGQNWHDALMNSAFIMGGLGTVVAPDSTSGKLFVSFYSLFVSLSLLATLSIVLAPVAHRIIHKFHLDELTDLDEEFEEELQVEKEANEAQVAQSKANHPNAARGSTRSTAKAPFDS